MDMTIAAPLYLHGFNLEFFGDWWSCKTQRAMDCMCADFADSSPKENERGKIRYGVMHVSRMDAA